MSRTIYRPTSFSTWLYEESNWDQKHDDREYIPALNAPNAHDQPWRIPRLQRTYETAKHLFIIVENRPLPATIVTKLSDNRGQLLVTVSATDWISFLAPFFHLAWRAENERPDAVKMELAGPSLT